MLQGRKKHTARPGLEPRTPRRSCEYSDHWAIGPHGRPVTSFPCLIRFVPESARNHAGTDETVPLLLAARARTHTELPNVTGVKKAHGPIGTRTQDLSHIVRALWPLSYRATRSTCDMRISLYSNFFWTRVCNSFISCTYEPRHDKTNKMAVRPVWSESSLSAWRKLGSLATHWAHSEDSDQTGRMPMLIWVFAGRTLILLVLSWCGSIMFQNSSLSNQLQQQCVFLNMTAT